MIVMRWLDLRFANRLLSNHCHIIGIRRSKPRSVRHPPVVSVPAKRIGEVSVLVLKATCPRCRAEVDTGVTADEHTLRECHDVGVLVLCDECREYQKMLVKDLYVAV